MAHHNRLFHIAAFATVGAALVATPLVATAIEVGTTAPAFNLPNVAGGNVSLASKQGKVVVIDFWASWCTPCMDAFDDLAALQKTHGSKGLSVLAVSIDDDRAAIDKAISGKSLPFTILHDAQAKVATAYGVNYELPATVVIDRTGKVRHFHSGSAMDQSKLQKLVAGLL